MNNAEIKIVILSDLCWHAHLRSMTRDEVSDVMQSGEQILRHQRIYDYISIIEKEQADVVLFAGDITGDGSCGHGFHMACLLLFKLIENKGIPVLYISGNHDPEEYYSLLTEAVKGSSLIQEISGKIVDVKGVKISGVNYDISKSKRKIQYAIDQYDTPIDILLAHSQIKRRIMHFDIPAEYIITGHYDRKLTTHREKIFIALDNDSEEISYGVIEKKHSQSDTASIKIRQNESTLFSYKEEVDQLKKGIRNHVLYVNDKPVFDLLKLENAADANLSRDGDHYLYLKYLRGINYASSMDTMYKMKQGNELGFGDLTLNQIHGLPITANYSISESMIEDYLGNVID